MANGTNQIRGNVPKSKPKKTRSNVFPGPPEPETLTGKKPEGAGTKPRDSGEEKWRRGCTRDKQQGCC